MNESDPLPPDLAALFRSERERPEVAGDVRERVMSRAFATLAADSAASGTTQAQHTNDSSDAARLPPAKVGAASLLASAPARWIVAGAFLAGGVVGAGIHAAAVRSREPERTLAPSVAPGPVPSVPLSSDAPVVAPDVPRASSIPTFAIDQLPTASARPSNEAPRVAPDARDTDLAAESAVVDMARAAIARGDGTRALDALERHERSFPKGRLAEEREALRIVSLVQAHRYDEARARADSFKRNHPVSLFLSTVESTIASIP